MGKAFKVLGVVVVIGCTYKIGEVVGTVKGFKGSFDIIKKGIETIAEEANEFKIIINGSEIALKSKEKENEPEN